MKLKHRNNIRTHKRQNKQTIITNPNNNTTHKPKLQVDGRIEVNGANEDDEGKKKKEATKAADATAAAAADTTAADTAAAAAAAKAIADTVEVKIRLKRKLSQLSQQ